MSFPLTKSEPQSNIGEAIFPRIDREEVVYPALDYVKPEVPSWLYDNIAELSKHTRTLHAIHVGFLIFCAFTVLSTSDRKIILDEQARLPIINLDIPFSGFVLAAPAVAIFIFLDLQIHLQTLRDMINGARAKYAAVEPGRLYPWIMNFAEEPERGPLGFIKQQIVKLSLWWLMPLVLILILIFTLKKHSTRLAAVEWVMSFVGAFLVLWFWRRYEAGKVQQKHSRAGGSWVERWVDAFIRNRDRIVFVAAILFAHFILLLMISPRNKIRTDLFNVDLSYQELIKERKEHLPYWILLRGANLDRANLYGAVLERADLRDARLQQSILQNTNLKRAHLSGADMFGALLSGAELEQAHLDGADLSGANLNCASLTEADFRKAKLVGAFLQGVDLRTAQNLEAPQLLEAVSLYKTDLKEEIKNEIVRVRPELFTEIPDQELVRKELVQKGFPPDDVYKYVEEIEFKASPRRMRLENFSIPIPVVQRTYTTYVHKKAGLDSYLQLMLFSWIKTKFKTLAGDVYEDSLEIKHLTDRIAVPCGGHWNK